MAGITRRMVMSPIPMTIQLSMSGLACNFLRADPSTSLRAGCVRRYVCIVEKIKGQLLGRPLIDFKNYYGFLGAIASFAALATRNFTTVLALIWMGSPVCGLRPTRALRCAFTRRPRPGTTKMPFFLVSLIAVSARCSRNAAAVLLGSSVFSARCRMSCVLVKPEAMYFLLKNRFNASGAYLIPSGLWKTPYFTGVFRS